MRHSNLIVGLLALNVFQNSFAATINVPANMPTIQGAINVAGTGDEIVVAPGVYFERIDFLGKAITVRSQNVLNPAATTINAGAGGRAVTFNSGEGTASKLSGITLTNGQGNPGGGGYVGFTSNPTIENCRFVNNQAVDGGGLAIMGNATVRSCWFSGNTATNTGGGVYGGAGGNMTLTNCRMNGNQANAGTAIYVVTLGTVIDAEIYDNVGGPAISLSGANPVNFINCTIVNNTGMGVQLANAAIANVKIANCIVTGNLVAQISGPAAHLNVRYSDVQGGFAGPGNISAAPAFVSAPAGDFRLLATSPCIDAGENASLRTGTSEDFNGVARLLDKPDVPDTGVGTPPIVDIGAHEYPPTWRYVKADATGLNIGMSWNNAYTDLQSALADAAVPASEITEIWVAAGTYQPDGGNGDRTRSFNLINGVSILGGFNGTEIDSGHTDPINNQTVLGGAIGNAGTADNSYHVVKAINVNSTAKLIGFIIQKGNANGNGVDIHGGGIYIDNASPLIRQCWIRQNEAIVGAGLYCVTGTPSLIRDRFNLNIASGSYAGAIFIENGNVQIADSFMSGNEANEAGAMMVFGGAATITNCTIVGNKANSGSVGGVHGGSGVVNSDNNILWGNTSSVAGPIEHQQIATSINNNLTIDYSCVQGWTGLLGGAGNFGTDPLFIDADGPDNVYGTADDDTHLLGTSACIDSADSAALLASINLDLDGNTRFHDDLGKPNAGVGLVTYLDRGAYEFQGTSCIGDVNHNGAVNVDDLLAVINSWGACAGCDADITGNGFVNVDDLLAVINHWGSCP